MSRSGYCDDVDDNWRHIMWRGAVKSAMKGKRGQAFLREAADALDSLPNKSLIGEELVSGDGQFCLLGAVGAQRGLDIRNIDPYNYEAVSAEFGISEAMAREIVYVNDEGSWSNKTPEQRWQRMRAWVEHWKASVPA